MINDLINRLILSINIKVMTSIYEETKEKNPKLSVPLPTETNVQCMSHYIILYKEISHTCATEKKYIYMYIRTFGCQQLILNFD